MSDGPKTLHGALAILNAALRSMGDLAFEVSEEGRYLSCFGPTELLPIPPREMIGKHVSEVLPPDVAAEALAAIRGALGTGALRVFEYELAVPDGLRHFEARVAPTGTGTALAVIRDVHEQRLAARKLTESELWLATTLRSMADAAIATGADGRIRVMNAFAAELTGWDAASAEGLALDDVLELREPGESWMTNDSGATKLLIARTGSTHVVEIDKAPIQAPGGKPLGMVWILRDVTRQMRLYAELADAVATRDDVLALVSHDLKNLVAALSLRAETYLRSNRDDETAPARKAMTAVRSAARRMGHLIGDLLDAGDDTPALALTIEPSSARALADEAVELLEPLAERKAQKIEVQEIGEGELECDRERMLRVLLNLLSNAIKFTPTGGKIALRVEHRAGGATRFAVEDTGPGVAEGDRERIFDRFFRRDTSVPGKGLGLYIARRIIEAHGGRIWVDGASGRGSTFYVELPEISLTAETSRDGA